MFSLDGKSAFITGGCSGIGLAIAKRFLKAGAKVVIADLQDIDDVASDIGALFIKCDVSKEADVSSVLSAAEKAVGKLDVVINNAGIGMVGPLIEDESSDTLRKLFEVNVYGVYYGLKYAPRHMNDGGSIINTASMAAFINWPGFSQYGATKATVVHLTKSAAIELGPRGIRVNSVCPTVIKTPILNEDESGLRLSSIMAPIGRSGTLDDLTGVYHFLAADESAYITSSSFKVDGGWSAGMSQASLDILMKE